MAVLYRLQWPQKADIEFMQGTTAPLTLTLLLPQGARDQWMPRVNMPSIRDLDQRICVTYKAQNLSIERWTSKRTQEPRVLASQKKDWSYQCGIFGNMSEKGKQYSMILSTRTISWCHKTIPLQAIAQIPDSKSHGSQIPLPSHAVPSLPNMRVNPRTFPQIPYIIPKIPCYPTYLLPWLPLSCWTNSRFCIQQLHKLQAFDTQLLYHQNHLSLSA